jgi:hypothetical protein
MDPALEAYGGPITAATKWFLPKPWQQYISLLGFATIAYGFAVKSSVTVDIGIAVFCVPFVVRFIIRIRLGIRGHSSHFSDDLSRAVAGPILHKSATLTNRDELAALVISDSGVPQWWSVAQAAVGHQHPLSGAEIDNVVTIEWVHRALGTLSSITIDKVESDVRKLVQDKGVDRWSRLAGIITGNLFDRWIYVVHPSFGNRYKNRSARVTVWKVGEWAPKQFSYWSAGSVPQHYHGKFEVSLLFDLPRSVERRLRSILSEGGFEVGSISDFLVLRKNGTHSIMGSTR